MASRPEILVIEDDPAVLRLVCTILANAGWSVRGLARGDQAITLLRDRSFDLVCVDLMLPTVSGLEVCTFIRATPHLRYTPVLVISARSLPLDRADALDAGASSFLGKPFNRQQLLEAVQPLLHPQAAAATGGAP